jgi:cobalt-zinc-cadmium efflux system protein
VATSNVNEPTILASLASGLLLLAAVGAIAWEAVTRFMAPTQPAGGVIMVVAAIGVVINTATALLFISGKDHDLNIRGAFLHMAADAAVSLGVVISGAMILVWQLGWIDPLVSLLIAVVIFASTWGLLCDSLNLAVDAVPRGIEPEKVREFLAGQDGVCDIHDLHIWGMSTTETALTAHLVMSPMPTDDRFLHDVAHQLQHRFDIHHATIQLERGDDDVDCHQAEGCAG